MHAVLLHRRSVDPVEEPKAWHYNFDVLKPLSAGVWVTVTIMMLVVSALSPS